MKRSFFQAAVVSILLYGCTTWTLTKRLEKKLVGNYTSRLLNSHKYNLWKNSMDTIDWFRKIKDKKRSTFVQFDVIEFYPSISKELLVRILNHAWGCTDITEEEIEIILASRITVLSDSRRSWVKSHVDNFDITMGAYDSAQVADLVGIYILDTLGRIVNLEQVGLTEMTELFTSQIVTARRPLVYRRTLLGPSNN